MITVALAAPSFQSIYNYNSFVTNIEKYTYALKQSVSRISRSFRAVLILVFVFYYFDPVSANPRIEIRNCPCPRTRINTALRRSSLSSYKREVKSVTI